MSRIDLATIPVLQGLLKQRLETCTAEKDAFQVSLREKEANISRSIEQSFPLFLLLLLPFLLLLL